MAEFSFRLDKDNTELILSACRQQRARAFEIIGMKAESNAKAEITAKKAIDTGRLRNSITHQVDSSAFVNRVVVGTNVEYGKYVELGTHTPEGAEWRMAPRPFIKPAIEDHISEYQSIIENELRK